MIKPHNTEIIPEQREKNSFSLLKKLPLLYFHKKINLVEKYQKIRVKQYLLKNIELCEPKEDESDGIQSMISLIRCLINKTEKKGGKLASLRKSLKLSQIFQFDAQEFRDQRVLHHLSKNRLMKEFYEYDDHYTIFTQPSGMFIAQMFSKFYKQAQKLFLCDSLPSKQVQQSLIYQSRKLAQVSSLGLHRVNYDLISQIFLVSGHFSNANNGILPLQLLPGRFNQLNKLYLHGNTIYQKGSLNALEKFITQQKNIHNLDLAFLDEPQDIYSDDIEQFINKVGGVSGHINEIKLKMSSHQAISTLELTKHLKNHIMPNILHSFSLILKHTEGKLQVDTKNFYKHLTQFLKNQKFLSFLYIEISRVLYKDIKELQNSIEVIEQMSKMENLSIQIPFISTYLCHKIPEIVGKTVKTLPKLHSLRLDIDSTQQLNENYHFENFFKAIALPLPQLTTLTLLFCINEQNKNDIIRACEEFFPIQQKVLNRLSITIIDTNSNEKQILNKVAFWVKKLQQLRSLSIKLNNFKISGPSNRELLNLIDNLKNLRVFELLWEMMTKQIEKLFKDQILRNRNKLSKAVLNNFILNNSAI